MGQIPEGEESERAQGSDALFIGREQCMGAQLWKGEEVRSKLHGRRTCRRN
jgi:hypothetical protein